MLDNQRFTSFRGEYSENLLPNFCTFDTNHSWNIVSGGSNAVVESSTNRRFSGERSVKITFLAIASEIVFDSGGTLMNFTAEKTGQYILSQRFFVDVSYSSDNPNFRCYTFVNGIAYTYTDFVSDLYSTSGFVNGEWNTYGQVLNLTAGDVVSFQFKAQCDTIGTVMYFDGFKAEYDDRNLGIPSIYSLPKGYLVNQTGLTDYRKKSDTGWATYEDTFHTVGAPQTVSEGVTALLTNNKGNNFETQLPDGVTEFFDATTTKMKPAAENDFMTCDLMFKVKNSLASGFFTVYVDIPTLGKRFEQTRVCPKDANTETGINIAFHHFVSNAFFTNGGIIKIVADKGNLQIYDKQFRFCRVHKAF